MQLKIFLCNWKLYSTADKKNAQFYALSNDLPKCVNIFGPGKYLRRDVPIEVLLDLLVDLKGQFPRGGHN